MLRLGEWALCGIFFASGATALLFETLWFRLAGLTFGNSVAASSIVLAAFMAGLALGNALCARAGWRVGRPLRAYALLELAIGGAGLALVLAFPLFARELGPRLAALADRPWLLNQLRLLLAFGLMLVPTTAMGATLPLLVRVLARHGFGRALGRLYGWNTLGAMAGALAGELWLIGAFGLRGTAYVAASVNAAAAAAAVPLARLLSSADAAGPRAAPRLKLDRRARRALLAAFGSGAILLAAEVVWFRFLQLFFTGTSLAFALMLVVVLVGIACGGFLAAWWLRRDPRAHLWAAAIALGQAWLMVLGYTAFEGAAARAETSPLEILSLSARLMLPVSALSGVLFALLGETLRESVDDHTAAAGLLTLANTSGAMCGALAGGFLLLPALGVEGALFLLASAYAGVALCARPAPGGRRFWLPAAATLLFLLAFPFGLMRNRLLPRVASRFGAGLELVAAREGLTETILYLRKDAWDQPHSYMLSTNGYPMSGTQLTAKRYMKQYVYLPLALLPRAERALLICFGVGSTAKALTDEPRLRSIDVVDVSRDVLELSRIVFPDPGSNPLDDPRVRRHVEDGRFFLQRGSQRFDLITGEPPPPKTAGVVNLYSREYFQLIHDRLSDGGLASYWLPVDQLHVAEARAILQAFCSVFPNCSLWTGADLNWMMIGGRGELPPASLEELERQWREALPAAGLRSVGFDAPELLFATYLADGEALRALAGDQPPLVDDFPRRLGPYAVVGDPWFRAVMDVRQARARFLASDAMRRLVPESTRERTAAAFGLQGILGEHFAGRLQGQPPGEALRAVLTGPVAPQEVALWLMGSDGDEQRLARAAEERGTTGPLLAFRLGLGALARRDFRPAETYFRRALELDPRAHLVRRYLALTSCLAGRAELAAEAARARARAADPDAAFWSWLRTACGVP